MTSYDSRHVAVIGVGPRGLLVIERLCANQRRASGCPSLTVHAIDPAPAGSGRVWRPEQPPHLLMNTVASQVTAFTDTSVCIDGPIEPGPSLYDWACILRDWATATPAATPPTGPGGPLHGLPQDLVPELPPALQAEAVALGPDSYPTRRFYGAYLQYCFARTVANAPAHVTVRVHRSRAVAMADTYGVDTGPQGVRLENGTRLDELEAVVLAQGHLPTRLTHREARAASLARIHHLDYRSPANPADVDLDSVQSGETVLIRGMGLSFFDYLAMLTTGRGGRFEQVQGRCRYIPSGREPHMVAFSRRGVPHHARGRNEKGPFGRYVPRLLTPEQICQLRAQKAQGRPVSFSSDLWPLIAREVEAVYYGALVERAGGVREEFVTRFLAANKTPAELNALLDDAAIDPSERWSWERLEHPTSGITFGNRTHFRSWMIGHLSADLVAAQAGNLSDPLKSALDVLRDLRNEIRLVVDHGGIDGESYRTELQGWYTPLNAYLSIGPPAERISEMIALLEAGLLDVTGPGTIVRIDPDCGAFVAYSTEVPGPEIVARTLVEARLPEPDLRRTTDPLLQHLLTTAQCRTYTILTRTGRSYESRGLAVGERPYRLVDQDGREHPRRFAFGVPTESVHWVTAAGARPGVDSVSLADADAIGRAVLELPAANGPAGSDPKLRLGTPPRKRNEREGMVV